MKTILPWILVLGLAAGAGYLFAASSKKDAELATLRKQAQDLKSLQAELEAAKATVSGQTTELTRLQKETEELLRLRNEVRQLRDQSQQLTKQLSTAQTAVESAKQQAIQLQTQNKQLQSTVQQNDQANQQATCINQLRLIDNAIQQWAVQKQKPANAPVTQADVAPLIPGGFPKCPAGGTYTLGTAGQIPICSIPGHALPQ